MLVVLSLVGCAAVPWSMLADWSEVEGHEVEGCAGECVPMLRFVDHGDGGKLVQAWAVDELQQQHAERVADEWTLTLGYEHEGWGTVDGCEVELYRDHKGIDVLGDGCGIDWRLSEGQR